MNTIAENSILQKSSFTVTFAIELLGIDTWHDCNQGWLDLGACSQGMKLQYQLYPGQNFELDVLLWPHCAKIWCGGQHYGWVRTWQYLERRWVTFSIRHAFPVRIAEFQNFVASITPALGIGALGSTAKNDKNFEIYLPALKFGERRYFGKVTETEDVPISLFICELLWGSVADHIPASFLDGQFDVPHVVTDVRHQDAVLYKVQQLTLNKKMSEEIAKTSELEYIKGKDKKQKSPPKKTADAVKTTKYELRLSGDSILAGSGRVVPFEVVGNLPPDLGQVVALISSKNLPAQDDMPMIFVNINNLMDVPVDELKKAGILEVYSRWSLGNEVRCSLPQLVRDKCEICLNDHHSVPLEIERASKIVAAFLENTFEIELLGTRKALPIDVNTNNQNKLPLKKQDDEENDIVIAVCKIDASALSKDKNGLVQGDFPVYPPKHEHNKINRDSSCTNDINAIRTTTRPLNSVPPSVILEAQMTLHVAMGYIGCIPKEPKHCYSRMYCLVHTEEAALKLVNFIIEINAKIKANAGQEEMLTGFALDSGSELFVFVEGSKSVRKIWEFTANYHDDIKCWFSTTARFSTRLYEYLLTEFAPFMLLKMHVPLSSLLACPSMYVRTALPLTARSAVLKLGRLFSGKFTHSPFNSEMPTGAELQSFRLELCIPPKPASNWTVVAGRSRLVDVTYGRG